MSIDDRILRLEETTHNRLKQLDPARTCVVVAISPLEAHGPHLPVGQDWFEAMALGEHTVRRVAEKKPDWTFLFLPPVPIADDCLPHLGSVPFPAPLVRDVAFRLMLPFARHGFARLIYTSFHGGPRHMTALEHAAHKLTRDYDTHAFSIFSAVVCRMLEGNVFFDAIKDHPDNPISLDDISQDWHAGFVETSLALHLWPQLVDDGWQSLPPAFRKVIQEENDKGAYFMGAGRETLIDRVNKVSNMMRNIKAQIEHYDDNTYSGSPARASEEMGRLMFEHLLDISTEICCDFLDRGTEVPHHTPLWKMRKILLDKNLNTLLTDKIGLYIERIEK
jgi:creatinine amidohydrolase